MTGQNEITCGTVLEPVRINSAEAIFLPAFDGKLHEIGRFTVEGAELIQQWDCCTLRSSARRVVIRWKGDVCWSGYDALRFFVSFPETAQLSGWACINDKRFELFRGIRGGNSPIEASSHSLFHPKTQSILSNFELELTQETTTELSFNLYWAGVFEIRTEAALEMSRSYPIGWPGLLLSSGRSTLVHPWVAPAAKMERWKVDIQLPIFEDLPKAFHRTAAQWLNYDPEPHIRDFLPVCEHLYRYARVRDRGRPLWESAVENLSLAGYLFDDAEFTQRAARMLLSIAETPNWFEGPQGCFPGSTWHHICFVEAHMMMSTAFALQFIGDALTPAGRQKVVSRIKEAFVLVNEYCEEPGYRWFMNQGLVFNSARLVGAAALFRETAEVYYRSILEQSYRDHCTIVGNYLGTDGHCPEGPHYFAYSMESSIPGWLAYAAFRELPVGQILPEPFRAAGTYLDITTSTLQGGGFTIPICASSLEPWPTRLLALLNASRAWKSAGGFLQNRFDSSFVQKNVHAWDIVPLLALPRAEKRPVRIPKTAALALPSGLASFEWAKPVPGKLVLLAERPSPCHHHFDRGSIYLEAGGQILLPDPGTTNYSDPKAGLMKDADWHNLACPAGLPMFCRRNLDAFAPSAALQFWPNGTQGCRFSLHTGMLFGPQVLDGKRSGHFEVSPGQNQGTLRLMDEWTFRTPQSLVLTYQSYTPWTVRAAAEGLVAYAGEDLTLRLACQSISWDQLQVHTLDDRTDWKSTSVHTLKIQAPPALLTRFTSTITFPLAKRTLTRTSTLKPRRLNGTYPPSGKGKSKQAVAR